MHVQELVEKLNNYTKLYDEGRPAISDKEWDNLYFKLKEEEEKTGVVLSNSPTIQIDYQVVNGLQKVEHNHPMLSLDKTKDIADIMNFAGKHDLMSMAKIDGLTCSIRYLNGKLISAETRGNGLVGEDITHNIIHVDKVPLTIPTKEEVIVDGEIICDYKTFEQFSNEYANPRNFAAGSIRLLDSKECKKRHLSFIAWDCIKGLDECNSLSKKFFEMSQQWGFYPAPWVKLPAELVNKDRVKHLIDILKYWSQDEFIPIDGIVFKYDNCEYYQSLGATGHHFRGGLAYKFYDDLYDTTLIDIEWTMGRTGELTPVARFKPIEIDSTIVERASLHNVSVMKDILGPKPFEGMDIKIYKANQIIPQVYKDDYENSDDLYLTPPDHCPICNGRTEIRKNGDIETLICTNEQCDGKLINQLDHFVGKKGLDVKGLSAATLEKLIDWGWIGNKIEIFSLKNFEQEWKSKPGFGEKSVDNILNAIEESKNCELHQFISSLGIPLIGSTYAKDICKHEFDWHNIREDIDGGFDFTEWDGFGYEMDKALHEYNYSEADEIAKILNLTNNLFNQRTDVHIDIKVCITGSLNHYKNRAELTAAIESIGGKVVSSVSKNTDILINNDIKSSSSKNQTAKKLNIPIFTEEDFINKYLT